MEERGYIDLLELQTRIKDGVAEMFPGRYWVKAEIASWNPRANGHCYLSLTQSLGGKPVAESRAMIWKWHYPQLVRFFQETTGQKLQGGITVLVRVQVSFSELYGISLFIDDIDPAFTLGEQALARKQAIERLQKDGYMDMQRELALPELPYRLAVISSRTAAGYEDFCRHLLQNPEGYAFQTSLFEAIMQGEQAPASIMAAIQEVAEQPFDALLILRGGGSELDLNCFDDYHLAVAIATCPIPVVTAIGHQKDIHIADLVAHASVKTPTALADLFLDAYREQDQRIDRLGQRIAAAVRKLENAEELRLQGADASIRRAVQRRLGDMARQTDSLHSRIRLGLVQRLSVAEKALQLSSGRISRGLLGKHAQVARLADNVSHRLRFAASARVGEEVSRIALKEALIKASDPRSILALGYVLVTGKDNKVLKTVEHVAQGDRIGVRFTDGSLLARVDEVYADKVDNDKINIA